MALTHFYTDDQTANTIGANLDEDLEELAQKSPPLLQPSLPPTTSGLLSASSVPTASSAQHTLQARFLLLQVLFVQDVSLSLPQRLRSMLSAEKNAVGNLSRGASEVGPEHDDTSAADATLQMCEDIEETMRQRKMRTSSGMWRILKFVLSDGFTRVWALEDVHSSQLADAPSTVLLPEGVVLGAKLKIRLNANGELPLRHGVLSLHAGNTTSIGGSVYALQCYWQLFAKRQLEAMTGRPSKAGESSTASEQELNHVVESLVLSQSRKPQHLPTEYSNLSRVSRVDSDVGTQNAELTADAQNAITDANGHMNGHHTGASTLPLQSPILTGVRPVAGTVELLREWPQHCARNPYAPFTTQAVITAVTSDMFIQECVLPGSPQTKCMYSLLVQLSPPRATNDTAAHGTDDLTVDLGDLWLEKIVGIPAVEFQRISASSLPSDVERLGALIEHVGCTLEGFGTGIFVLQQRAHDGMVEVIAARQCVDDSSVHAPIPS